MHELPPEIVAHNEQMRTKLSFMENLRAAEQHWFFVQGFDAYHQQLYVPAMSSLLNGIEATLRVTLHQNGVEGGGDLDELSPYKVLSNNLILKVEQLGVDVSALALEDHDEFKLRLASTKPNRVDVEVVRLRNNICHGNITEFIDKTLGEGNYIFVPELLKETTEALLNLSVEWCATLGSFRRKSGF